VDLVFLLFVGAFVACACVIVPLVAVVLSAMGDERSPREAEPLTEGRDSLEPLSRYEEDPSRERETTSILDRGGARAGSGVNRIDNGLVNAERSREKSVPAPEATV
jgi:hypothetical protein